ncbi:MAG TPA: hypothetical protein EYG70_05405 [Sulfurimonas sp.]|nr:hypothetical protein [Sulfurimonas sp.]
MKKIQLMDKYPVFTITLHKEGFKHKNADTVITYFKELIDKHPVATYIAIFDHYTHTCSLEDRVLADDIIDAKNIIFCFGKQLPNAQILAVRPRSLGVCEFDDRFEISFLEVPNEQLQTVVTQWVEALKN